MANYTGIKKIKIGDNTFTFAIPESTSELRNDSGFITSYTDNKVSTAAASNNTIYYPVMGTNTTSATTKYYSTNFAYKSTTTDAYLTIGDDNNIVGNLTFISATQYTGTITTDDGLMADRTYTLPNQSGYIALTSDLPTTTAVTPSITTTTGALKTSSAYKCGSVAVLSISVQNSSAVASGGNLFTGNLTTSSLLPATYVTGGGYYGGYPIMFSIGTTGSIVVRNAHSSSITISGSNYATITLTYLTN